jgi:hypothetical protein
LLEAPIVHAYLAPAATLAVADQDRAAARIEVAFTQSERLLDAKPATPEDDDQCSQPGAMAVGADLAHHGDDLLDGWWIGRVAHPLVTGRSSGVVAGRGCGRAATPGGIENSEYGHGILLPSHSG